MPPFVLRLTRSHFEAIADQARAQPDVEVCGLLGGQGSEVRGVFPVRNSSPVPETRFLMDSRSFLDAFFEIERRGWELVAIYHSHPVGGRGDPSPTDIAKATYPSALNLIVSFGEDGRPIARVFQIDDVRSFEVKLELIEGEP